MNSTITAKQSMPPALIHRIGDYYLIGHLGRGGMADVYLARYIGAAGFQRTVVIKRVLNVGDPACTQMFINEAKLAAELTHPNIVQLYELGEIHGEFFIAMEYVRGMDLGKLLNAMLVRQQPVPRAVAAFIAREICRALAHAHAHVDPLGAPRPIIHRDISPGNVIISYDGQVKLVDFGIAKALQDSPDVPQTQAGIIKGKLGYMAPEQLDGHTTPQCDIFSTGVVLHELLTMRRLIRGDNMLEQVTKLKTMPFPPPSLINAGVGPDLDAIVCKALERNLGLRYAAVSDMAKDLDAIVQAERFSVEDLGRFMGEVFPPETRSDPTQVAGSVGSQIERALTSSALSLAVAPNEVAAVHLDGASPGPSAPRLVRRGVFVLGVAILAAAGGGAGYVFHRSPEEHNAATALAAGVRGAPPPVAPAADPRQAAIPPSAVRGVTDREIVFGMATAMSGSAKEYGRQMKLGIEAAFQHANDRGGVHGRQLRLVTVDDGYEPARTASAMKELYEHHGPFGIVGNFGTPTAAVALPFALDHKMLFFGAYSGAALLRRDPPDRYVFNFRASYAEEASAIVSYLIRVRRIRPEHIAVLAQDDAFGDSVYASLSKTMRALRPEAPALFRVGYQRNTVDVEQAVAQLRARGVSVDAVVLLALSRPAAKFIEQLSGTNRRVQFITGSWIDREGLSEELKMLGPRYANGVVVTQVVPSPESSATAVLDFKAAMARQSPEERIDSTALEGYLMANVLIEALRRAGHELDTERLVAALEAIRDFDLGIGTPIAFSSTEHQGSHKVWGTRLGDAGHYEQIDLE
jgi:branched-chain amino acid transport system substrate-binding protein